MMSKLEEIYKRYDRVIEETHNDPELLAILLEMKEKELKELEKEVRNNE